MDSGMIMFERAAGGLVVFAERERHFSIHLISARPAAADIMHIPAAFGSRFSPYIK